MSRVSVTPSYTVYTPILCKLLVRLLITLQLLQLAFDIHTMDDAIHEAASSADEKRATEFASGGSAIVARTYGAAAMVVGLKVSTALADKCSGLENVEIDWDRVRGAAQASACAVVDAAGDAKDALEAVDWAAVGSAAIDGAKQSIEAVEGAIEEIPWAEIGEGAADAASAAAETARAAAGAVLRSAAFDKAAAVAAASAGACKNAIGAVGETADSIEWKEVLGGAQVHAKAAVEVAGDSIEAVTAIDWASVGRGCVDACKDAIEAVLGALDAVPWGNVAEKVRIS